MTFIEQQQRGQEILDTIIRKSWEDEGFKQELITNPKMAISRLKGKNFKLNSDFEVIVEDQSNDTTIYLNIPAKPNLDELELTEEQLAIVSGGENIFYELGYIEAVTKVTIAKAIINAIF